MKLDWENSKEGIDWPKKEKVVASAINGRKKNTACSKTILSTILMSTTENYVTRYDGANIRSTYRV